jgi:hypothetical protein
MSEQIVAQGSVHCSVMGGNVEVVVVEIERVFLGNKTEKRLLCPHLDRFSRCELKDDKGDCGINWSL